MKIFESVASLKLSKLQVGQNVSVKGVGDYQVVAGGNSGVVLANANEAIPDVDVTVKHFGAVGDGVTETLTELQAAADAASALGVSLGSVVDLYLPHGVYIVDVGVGSSTEPALKLKNYTRLTGPGTIKAQDNSYTTGNPPIIGNDQSVNGNKEIYIDGIGVDANATNNVETTGGAISILFGRPVGPSGGPGAVGVSKGSIKNIRAIDTSFIAVQVKDGSDQISISNITNNGGHYAVQAAGSTQIDISTILSRDTINNAVDVFGNNGDEFTISGKSGTYIVGDTVTGSSSGATARLLEDNGLTLQMDTIVGTFTVSDTMTGGGSGATSTFVSKAFTKGNFSGSIRGVHADGCLTGVFLESVFDVPVSDCVIRNPVGNGCIINRINSITSGNRVVNFTVENAGSAGLLYSGEVTDNHCEISVDGATDGVRFNGSSFNSASDCKLKSVTNGYKMTGTGNKNVIEAGVVNTADIGFDVGSGQTGTTIEKVALVGVTTRLVDAGVDTRYVAKEDGAIVEVSGAGDITPNLDAGTIFHTTTDISTAIGINVPSGSKTKGQRLVLILKQDGTGTWVVTFNAIFKIKTAASTTANRRSHYEFVWTGTFWESISEVIDF